VCEGSALSYSCGVGKGVDKYAEAGKNVVKGVKKAANRAYTKVKKAAKGVANLVKSALPSLGKGLPSLGKGGSMYFQKKVLKFIRGRSIETLHPFFDKIEKLVLDGTLFTETGIQVLGYALIETALPPLYIWLIFEKFRSTDTPNLLDRWLCSCKNALKPMIHTQYATDVAGQCMPDMGVTKPVLISAPMKYCGSRKDNDAMARVEELLGNKIIKKKFIESDYHVSGKKLNLQQWQEIVGTNRPGTDAVPLWRTSMAHTIRECAKHITDRQTGTNFACTELLAHSEVTLENIKGDSSLRGSKLEEKLGTIALSTPFYRVQILRRLKCSSKGKGKYTEPNEKNGFSTCTEFLTGLDGDEMHDSDVRAVYKTVCAATFTTYPKFCSTCCCKGGFVDSTVSTSLDINVGGHDCEGWYLYWGLPLRMFFALHQTATMVSLYSWNSKCGNKKGKTFPADVKRDGAQYQICCL